MAPRWIGRNGLRMLCATGCGREAVTRGRCPACLDYLRRHGFDRRLGDEVRHYERRKTPA